MCVCVCVCVCVCMYPFHAICRFALVNERDISLIMRGLNKQSVLLCYGGINDSANMYMLRTEGLSSWRHDSLIIHDAMRSNCDVFL